MLGSDYVQLVNLVARPAGFEPTTPWFVGDLPSASD